MVKKVADKAQLSAWANLSRSVLNGIVGDYLEEQHNPLAIDMDFYYRNQALVLDQSLALQMGGSLTNKVIVFVHGLTNLETVWDMEAKNEAGSQDSPHDGSQENAQEETVDRYGARLDKVFGYTSFYIRYNTGLPILENSRNFDALLDLLAAEYPIDIDELILVGFSMGGLLVRGAQQYAQQAASSTWLPTLSQCYYIGTPHEGSPVAKFGNLTSSLVRMVPKDYVSLWADWIDVRSEGIKDLKEGLLNLNTAKRKGVAQENEDECNSFSSAAEHYFISGSVSEKQDSLLNKTLGDSLVRKTSAKPSSAPKGSPHAHFEGISHIPLAHSEAVYLQLEEWIAAQETKVELKQFSDTGNIEASSKAGLSNEEIFTGSIDLLASAYQQTVNTVETMQRSIADEPFSVLKKIPIVSTASETVEGSHKEILNTIYFSLKTGGKLVHQGSKLAAKGVSLMKEKGKEKGKGQNKDNSSQ